MLSDSLAGELTFLLVTDTVYMCVWKQNKEYIKIQTKMTKQKVCVCVCVCVCVLLLPNDIGLWGEKGMT